MTPSERRLIEEDCARLIRRYANLTDAHDWDALVDLYAEDGLMTRPTAPDKPIVGRAALREAFTSRPPRISQHVCANIVVDVLHRAEAAAFSVILLFTGKAAEDGGLPLRDEGGPLVGTYRDRLILTPQGWRFAERRGALTFRP